ncbi:MAG: DUF1571 domain-containing protein [Phycisphaerae bacterium]
MPRDSRRLTQRKVQILMGLFLAGILYAEFGFSEDYEPILRKGSPVVLAAESVEADGFELLVRHKPLDALKEALKRIDRENRDYTCTFVKQERLSRGMAAEQEVQVKFRPQPYSLMMKWTRNPGLAEQVIYVKGRWIDEDADDPNLRDLAVARPNKMARMIVGKSIKQPIRGFFAKRSSRRSLDEFGFKRALDLLIKYCDLAESRGELKLEFKGETYFDGRPVWLIRRSLPYRGEGGRYPDRVADIYIDKEYQVPVAVYCFSGDERIPENLLGKYEYREVRFDVELDDAVFEPATYGM